MSTPDPFQFFAFECEGHLRFCRANIIAVHELLGSKADSEPDVRDAIGHLVADAYIRMDALLEMHGKVFEALQKARAA